MTTPSTVPGREAAGGDGVIAPAVAPEPLVPAPPAPVAAPPVHGGGTETLAPLALAALGVVYGDIGTSPLYALRECFHGPHAVPPTPENVLGVLSLITWSLIVIVTGKYLAFVLDADNHGEGGILALMALAQRTVTPGGPAAAVVVALGVFGAALLYGDGVITPAISVLSAVEGLAISAPMFQRFIIPTTLAILVALFAVQRRGTHVVGRIFGPVTLVWFVVLFVLGARALLDDPSVIKAVLPNHALAFVARHGWHALGVMGAVFLVVTGGEALYADMGHFGRDPIRAAWFLVVLPALLVNYMGQGALLIRSPAAAENPFYALAPGWALLPLVVLATGATVIASQALISGVFSLTRQAVQLGYWPRMEIIHTSAEERGQIYIPVVNWALLVGVVLVVLGFRTSSALAAAYGIAVTTTMIITALLAFRVARHLWNWSARDAVALTVLFLVIEGAFFLANLLKIADGGWLPLVMAGLLFAAMMTWKRGRTVLGTRLAASTVPLDFLLAELDTGAIHRVRGTAVFMTGTPEGTPAALLHNLKYNRVLHQQVIVLTIEGADVPTVAPAARVRVEHLRPTFHRVSASYGFMETADMTEILAALSAQGVALDPMQTTYFLGRESLVPATSGPLPPWQARLFAFMSRNARPPTQFFGIPPNRVVEMGARVEL